MKATFVGGGAHRLLPILRLALTKPGVLNQGEIYLHDLDVSRAEALGRILQQTPEYQCNQVTVRCGKDLDEALAGADVVSVVLMAGSDRSFQYGNLACRRHGFLGTDNISPSGSFLALKGAPILLDIAGRMERLCPDAWLVDFANPVAVLSGMINRHTRIRALGVCAGFANHQWDLARIFGKDEWSDDFVVTTAGVNHLSFIMDGTRQGRDLLTQLDDHLLQGDWHAPQITHFPPPVAASIQHGIQKLVNLYREHRFMVFSTEPDGMCHFYYDEEVRRTPLLTEAEVDQGLAAARAKRQAANADFHAHSTRHLDAAFWEQPYPHNNPFSRIKDDIFVRVLQGISKAHPAEIVSSRLNEGAIEGIPDDFVVEYSQRLHGHELRPVGRFRLPPVAQSLIYSIAHHQTLLGDACFSGDPNLLAAALKAYPVKAFSQESRDLYRELFAINHDEIPASLREAVNAF